MTYLHKQFSLPNRTANARIDALAHDGRGIAHVEGKAVFIQGALPGEEVSFSYTARHNKHDEAQAQEIIQPGADRVEPRCAHFGTCGGCNLQHLNATQQIAFKQDFLLDNLARIGKVRPEQVLAPLTGPHWGYRHKARLGVKYVRKKGRVLVGFRERNSRFLADLRRCEVLHPRVGSLLEQLTKLVEELSIRERVPQIEVAVGDTAVALNFRVLDPPTSADKARLMVFGQEHNMQIYLQPKGPETTHLLWPEDEDLYYRLPNHDLTFEFRPNHFTQVNPEINQKMVDRVVELLELQQTDQVLDLFCGLGNFTLPLARKAREVVGIEADHSLVDWAQYNARRNSIDNVRFFTTDLMDEVATQPWMQESYHKVLLDPPRLGALEMMPHLAALGAHRVVYVSCHPATLARDAGELVHRFGYRLINAGVMDMFPHTAHVESVALFERS